MSGRSRPWDGASCWARSPSSCPTATRLGERASGPAAAKRLLAAAGRRAAALRGRVCSLSSTRRATRSARSSTSTSDVPRADRSLRRAHCRAAGDEAALRLLPVSTATMTGYHHDPDLLTYPSHRAWRVSTGWDLRNPQRLAATTGASSPIATSFPTRTAVALIGDSYVEASMLDTPERPAAQLAALLGPAAPRVCDGQPGYGSARLRAAHSSGERHLPGPRCRAAGRSGRRPPVFVRVG